jgi:mRNA-degrading endonuclease RelE of RelBE toxin-antitoxin system
VNAFRIEFSQQAGSYFKRLGKEAKARVEKTLRDIAADPVENSKRLVNRGGQRSTRVGELRILFDLDQESSKLMVTAILPRGDVYKHTKR